MESVLRREEVLASLCQIPRDFFKGSWKPGVVRVLELGKLINFWEAIPMFFFKDQRHLDFSKVRAGARIQSSRNRDSENVLSGPHWAALWMQLREDRVWFIPSHLHSLKRGLVFLALSPAMLLLTGVLAWSQVLFPTLPSPAAA